MSDGRGMNPRSQANLTPGWAAANDVRFDRAELKGAIKDGTASIHDVLIDPPRGAVGAKVTDMLLALPSVGRVKVDRMLAQMRLPPSKTVGGLSEFEREDLVWLLRAKGLLR